jgi:hypothetical protein
MLSKVAVMRGWTLEIQRMVGVDVFINTPEAWGLSISACAMPYI